MNARSVLPVSTLALAMTAVFALVSFDADARGGARGGGGGARTSINSAGGGARAASGGTRSTAGSAGANRGGTAAANRGNNTAGRDVNRDTSRSRSTERNTNIERNTNVDIDVEDDGWFGEHPIAGMAAIGTAAAMTAAAIGSVVYSVPPSCVTSVVNGMTYQQCGGTWYEPQYVGTTVQYVVVNPPQ
jgi:hypothetical protein